METLRSWIAILSTVLLGLISIILTFALIKFRQEQNTKDIEIMRGDGKKLADKMDELGDKFLELIGALQAQTKEQSVINEQFKTGMRDILEELKLLRSKSERHETDIAILKTENAK